jgi:hypothetical protein
MVNNTVVLFVKEKKQDISVDEGLLHFNLKMLCFAGIFPYVKVCNTPMKIKLFRAYQISLYILFCPMFFLEIVELYLIPEDVQLFIETILHIVMGLSAYFIVPCINWHEVYKLICEINMSMPTKNTTQTDKNTTEFLRETRKKCKFMSLFFIILGTLALFFGLYHVFFLHILESIVGVEHKYKRKPNTANLFESLLLEKYPFSCWAPFDKKSVTAHLAMYIYTTIPVLMMAFRSGSATCASLNIIRYISLQFKFVSESLERLSDMENYDSQMEQNIITSPEKQNTSEESIYRDCQVSATDELFPTQNKSQVPECSNEPMHRDTSTITAHCLKDQEHQSDSDRLPDDNKSSPEDCLETIIKKHQEAIR